MKDSYLTELSHLVARAELYAGTYDNEEIKKQQKAIVKSAKASLTNLLEMVFLFIPKKEEIRFEKFTVCDDKFYFYFKDKLVSTITNKHKKIIEDIVSGKKGVLF